MKTALLFPFFLLLAACSTSILPDKIKKQSESPSTSPTPDTTAVALVKNNTPASIESKDVAVSPKIQPTPAIQQIQTKQTLAPVTPKTVVVEKTKSSFIKKNGQTALLLEIDYAKAWSQVGHIINQTGYAVLEQDSGLGTYYLVEKTTTGTIKKDAPIYQLHLDDVDHQTTLTLCDAKNQPVNAVITQHILTVLQQKIEHSSVLPNHT